MTNLKAALAELAHEALSDAESLGHPLCGAMQRQAARESKAELLAAIAALQEAEPAAVGARGTPEQKCARHGAFMCVSCWRGVPFVAQPLTSDQIEDIALRREFWFDPANGGNRFAWDLFARAIEAAAIDAALLARKEK
jgi:hypothetical protein